MTSSDTDDDLATLIDRVMTNGQWVELKLFMRPDGLGAFVVMRAKNSTGYNCDQIVDPNVPPSAHIKAMLNYRDTVRALPTATIPVDKCSDIQQNVDIKPVEKTDDFDDLLG